MVRLRLTRTAGLVLILLISFGLAGGSLAAADNLRGPRPASQGGSPGKVSETPANLTHPPSALGGPDDFGYRFRDSGEGRGPSFEWIELSASGTPLTLTDEIVHGPIDIGFPFDFYGTVYTQAWFSSNGWLSFGPQQPTSHPFNECPLPNPAVSGVNNIIAALWDDFDAAQNAPPGSGFFESFSASSCPYSGASGACFVAEWSGTFRDNDPSGVPLTFELVLFDNDILVQILDAGNGQGDGSTTGIENPSGDDGLTYRCNTVASIRDQQAVRFYYPQPAPELDPSAKLAEPVVLGSQPLSYTLLISNVGVLTATQASLVDPLLPGVAYITSSLACTSGSCAYLAPSRTITWTGVVAPGDLVTASFAINTPGLVCGTAFTNQAALEDPNLFAPLTLTHQATIWDSSAVDDFEANDGGFVADPAGEWEWGPPAYPPDISPYSGANVWGTNLNGPAADGPEPHVLTWTVALPNIPSLALGWWDWYGAESDDVRRVSVNRREVWQDASNQQQREWVWHSMDLSPWAGRIIDIVFALEAGGPPGGPDGWYLDDVILLFCDPPTTPYLSNSSKDGPNRVIAGSTYPYTITISNQGAATATGTTLVDSLPAGVTFLPGSVTGGGVYNTSLNQIEWSGDLPPFGIQQVGFQVTTGTGSGEILNRAVISQSVLAAPVTVSKSTWIAGAAAPPFCAGFESGTLPGNMITETTSAGASKGRAQVSSGYPYSGTFAFDLDTNPPGEFTRQAGVLVFDLDQTNNVELRFWIQNHRDEPHDSQDGVFISDDNGINYTKVFTFPETPLGYEEATLNLSDAAASLGFSLSDPFLVKFQSYDNFSIPDDGFSFDELCVFDLAPNIELSPSSLNGLQNPDQIVSQTLMISNTGSQDLIWFVDHRQATAKAGAARPLPPGSQPLVRQFGESAEASQRFKPKGPNSPESPAVNILQDGGFEAGTPNPFWQEYSANFGTPICDLSCSSDPKSGPLGGDYWAWFGGTTLSETSSLTQTITIPQGTAGLHFWLQIRSASGTGNDRLKVSLDSTPVFTVTDQDMPLYPQYTPVNLDISAFADGGAHRLAFKGTFSGGGVTNFFVDEVSLDATPGGYCPGDIPWVQLSPIAGTTASGEFSLVQVGFNSTGLNPGVYHGDLCVVSNDPGQPLQTIPLTMTVQSPSTHVLVRIPLIFNNP